MTTQTSPTGNAARRDPVNSKKLLWAGRTLSGLAALFCAIDGGMKLLKAGIGMVLRACILLYVFTRTSILGAVWLTGYMGGAAASQIRVGAGWFNVMFAVIFGVLVWAGLGLRGVGVWSFARYR